MMLNKSFTYVLPMLSPYMDIEKYNLKNTFIGDEAYKQHDNNIFLLYRFYGSKEFLAYEDYLKSNELFVGSYDPDEYHVMYIFKVPEEFQKDYDLFKAGKYSELDYEYKVIIFSFHNILDPKHRVAKVLFKHPELHQEWEERTGTTIPEGMEVSSIPDMSKEVYNDSMKTINPNRIKPIENNFK